MCDSVSSAASDPSATSDISPTASRSEASRLVEEFHRVTGLPVFSSPRFPGAERARLRAALISEEAAEFAEAASAGDLVGMVDALADLLYVTYGAALELGVDVDAAFREVHRSNMTKLWTEEEARAAVSDPDHPAVRMERMLDAERGWVVFRADGKVLKGPGFSEPDLARFAHP